MTSPRFKDLAWNFFAGAANLTLILRNVLRDSEAEVYRAHMPMATPHAAASQPGQATVPTAFGDSALGYAFDTASKAMHRTFKIPLEALPPEKWIEPPAFHVHWAPTGAANEDGKTVTWEIVYSIVNGRGDTIVDYTLTTTDTYTDASSNLGIHRSDDITIHDDTLALWKVGYYVNLRIRATANTLSGDPALFGVDIMFDEWNKTPRDSDYQGVIYP